jgi:16S rRNA processing protein RimM
MSRRLAVAVVTKPHGIRGELRLKCLGDDPSVLLNLDKVYLSKDNDDAREIKKAWHAGQDIVCIAMDGIESRNDAEELRGMELYMDADESDLEEGTYYVFDLIGCDVHDENGAKLGKVTDVLKHGAADVYVVKGKRNFMMPALKRVLINVDTQSKVIVISSKTLAEVAVYED